MYPVLIFYVHDDVELFERSGYGEGTVSDCPMAMLEKVNVLKAKRILVLCALYVALHTPPHSSLVTIQILYLL